MPVWASLKPMSAPPLSVVVLNQIDWVKAGVGVIGAVEVTYPSRPFVAIALFPSTAPGWPVATPPTMLPVLPLPDAAASGLPDASRRQCATLDPATEAAVA